MRPLRLLPLVAVLILAACGGEPEPFELQIRTLVTDAEAAAEAKDLEALMEVISDDYAGPLRESKRDLENLARFTLARHGAIHLYTRVGDLNISDSTYARPTVFVALGGRPISGPEELESMRGSLWRFDLLVQRDGDEVHVTQAQWRRARPDDFL